MPEKCNHNYPISTNRDKLPSLCHTSANSVQQFRKRCDRNWLPDVYKRSFVNWCLFDL